MKKFISTLIFVVSVCASVFAQEELFKVLINKGKNVVDHEKPIFTGSKIFKGQVITVSTGGYIGLIYKNGRSMELKVPGDYPVEKLEINALASSGSLSKKYADLVVNEMTKTSEGITQDRKKNMKVTGSVERGGDDAIIMVLPKNTDLLGSQMNIKWLSDKTSKAGYVVKIKDMFDEPLKTYNTQDTTLAVNISDLNLKAPNKSFIVSVEPKIAKAKSSAPEGKLVKVLEGKKADDLHKELKMVKEEAGDESALSKVILATFCEQNKLVVEAIHYYEQAMQLEPNVEEYRFAYENFLARNDISLIADKK